MTRVTLLLLLMQTLIGWAVSHVENANFDLRLVGSPNACAGRVEIYYNHQWGTVCDDYWDMHDANVVCRQVGCGSARTAHQEAHFGEGSGLISLDDLRCTGDEATLYQCQHSGLFNHDCDHYEDAAVTCEASNPTLRVVGTDSQCVGRVEMLHNGVWGTVCDDYWDIHDAEVACRQLDCGSALDAPGWAFFGQGNGTIFLDNVHCTGEEASLEECEHNGVGNHNCGSFEDASVTCKEPVRLQDGPSHCSGRVEILHRGVWGTVCDDGWTIEAAEVVCRQMGCGRAKRALADESYGHGTGQIWLDELACNGSEYSLKQCTHIGFGTHNCGHHEDVNVECEEIPNFSVRLVGSDNRCSGRVEIYNNYRWGSVCDDRWGLSEAQVVCRQMGCGRAVEAPQMARFGQSSGPIWLDNLHCRGNESTLSECGHDGVGVHNCRHVEDASVVCEESRALTVSAEISCSRYLFEVGVPIDSLVEGRLNPYSGHMANPYCHSFRMSGHTLWYRLSRWSRYCGTVMKTNATHVTYYNALHFCGAVNSTLGLPDIIPFSCSYPLHAEVSMDGGIIPQLHEGGLVGLGSNDLYMEFFHSSTFQYPYPPGQITLAMGSIVHMQITWPGNDHRMRAVLDDCYTTSSSDPEHNGRYYLIHNGCSTNPLHITVLETGTSPYLVRAEFLLYSLGSNGPTYVHCSLHMCDSRVGECTPTCNRRERRALKAKPLAPRFITSGPIFSQK